MIKKVKGPAGTAKRLQYPLQQRQGSCNIPYNNNKGAVRSPTTTTTQYNTTSKLRKQRKQQQ